MTHRRNAKTHFKKRLFERYGINATQKEIDTIRLLLKNRLCFLSVDSGSKIYGIVRCRNKYITAVYSKRLDGVVTAGCRLKTSKRYKS